MTNEIRSSNPVDSHTHMAGCSHEAWGLTLGTFEKAVLDSAEAGRELARVEIKQAFLDELPVSGNVGTVINIEGKLYWWRGDTVSKIVALE